MAIGEVFTSILFGDGAIFGWILLTTLIAGFSLKWHEVSVIMVPVCLLMAMEYVNHSLGWYALLTGFLAVFLVFNLIRKMKD